MKGYFYHVFYYIFFLLFLNILIIFSLFDVGPEYRKLVGLVIYKKNSLVP
jgi:hypothetical protein